MTQARLFRTQHGGEFRHDFGKIDLAFDLAFIRNASPSSSGALQYGIPGAVSFAGDRGGNETSCEGEESSYVRLDQATQASELGFMLPR